MMMTALLIVTGLAMQGTVSAPPTPTEALGQAYALFLQGRALDDKGDVDGAIAAYRKALEIAPKAAEVHAELAGLYATQGKAAESIGEARAALAIDPWSREANRIYGFVQAAMAERTLDSAGQQTLMVDAISHFEQALSGGRRDPAAELRLGRLYVDTEKYQQGIDRLQLFLLDQPGYPEAMLALAEAYDGAGRPADALAVLEALVSEEPNDAQARAMLAQAYEQASRWPAAAAAWGELARRTPRNTLYRSRQVTALINGGDLDGARRLLLDITTQSPRDASGWYLLSQVERRAGNAAAAESAARHILDLDATDARGALALAGAKSARGDAQGAVETLEPRVASATDRDVASGMYARLAGDLAAAYEQTGARDRAIRALEDARRRAPDDRTLSFALAATYERDTKFDQAERMFRDIVTREPSNAEALNYLGYMLADRGQKLPEAVELISRALKIEVGNPSFLDSLGWAYVKLSKLDDARDPLEQAAAALPKVSVIQDHLGELYFQLKRYRDAATAWDRALGGDREGIDAAAVTRKRDRARELAGR
jgi:tetratricopeptide (TPR) repeat protein